MTTLKFLVRFNTHALEDNSDKPRSVYRVVEADTSSDARQVICDMRQNDEQVGGRYIGSVHQAEVYQRPTGQY